MVGHQELSYGSLFDLYLGEAFVAAETGDHDGALKHLEWAFGIRPATGLRAILTYYQIVEAALWLYEDFQDPRYLALALEWSKNYQVVAPTYSWVYAVVAKYSEVPEVRRRALGIALYLDRGSWLLSAVPESDKTAARELFEETRPLWSARPRGQKSAELRSYRADRRYTSHFAHEHGDPEFEARQIRTTIRSQMVDPRRLVTDRGPDA